jgi:cytochrome c oxidase assembly factor CtaG
MNGLVRLIYVIAAMVPMSIVGAYLNRASHIVYGPYGAAAHALGISAMNDQAQAGAIMWVAGGVAMAAVGLWSAMSALIEEERRQRAREAYAEVAR